MRLLNLHIIPNIFQLFTLEQILNQKWDYISVLPMLQISQITDRNSLQKH